MAFLPLFPIPHGVTGSVFREHSLSPASFSQSLNFASRISFLPFCVSFVPIRTRLFCSSSWKPVQTPMRSAALALPAKSLCHPPWSHSPSCLSRDGGTQLQAWSVVLQRSLLSDSGRGWIPGVCSCLAFSVGSRVSQTWALLSVVHFILKPEEPNA